jgi:UDP-N-acetylglucosamine:LPS N-acetylglucosamine transferase
MVVLADNQRESAAELQKAGAANYLELSTLLHQDLYNQLRSLLTHPILINRMSNCASAITTGLGTEHIGAYMKISLN